MIDDESFIECMDLLEEYFELKEFVEKNLRRGFIELAEFRCVVGKRGTGLQGITIPHHLQISEKSKHSGSESQTNDTISDNKDESFDSELISNLADKFGCMYVAPTVTRRDGFGKGREELMMPMQLKRCQKSFEKVIEAIRQIKEIRAKIEQLLNKIPS